MPAGKVKFYNAAKGWGFIEPDDGGKDIFVHVSAVAAAGLRDLPGEPRLSYELGTKADGKVHAINLQLEDK